MLKQLIALALFALLLITAAGCANAPLPGGASDKLSVVASFYTMYDFACKIGGDKAEVSILVPSGVEPHDWEPSTSDIVSLERADVFIYNGAGMEGWAEDILSSLSNRSLTVVEASKGVPLIYKGSKPDPHVWLDPKLAKLELVAIKDALAAADPDNASYYQENYDKYAAEFDALDSELREGLSACPKKDIVVAHEAYGYLCEAYGLNQIAIEGVLAESEPDPARMAEIVNIVRDKGINVIFFEELISPKVAQSIADETGAQVSVLNPLDGLSDEQIAAGGDYISVMRKNLEELKKALK
ncbi:MAG: metal ABC transporter substrate-binding protein [Burkholderiales bacterium]